LMGLAAIVKPAEVLAKWPRTAGRPTAAANPDALFAVGMWGLSSFAFGAIAGTMVIAGLVLTQTTSWWFLVLAGAGAFGPGMLRELGLLRDKDEFERRAAQRAGYHAYLVTGMAMFVVYAFTRAGHHIQSPEELSGFFLSLLCFTWMFSSLFAYWGPHRTAFVILLVFGVAWAVFNIWSNLAHPVGMLMQLLVTTVPFFALAFVSRRWPRVAGALLVALAVAFYVVFDTHPSRVAPIVRACTFVLFGVPLLASGRALLGPREREEGEGEAPAP